MVNGVILLVSFLAATGLVWGTNWIALWPWREAKGRHWSEQARALYPAMVAARTNLWTMPGLAALVVLIRWPDSSPLWLFAGIAAALGAFAGTLPLDREVFPRIKLNDLLRQGGISCLLRFLVWTIFLGITVFMPSEFSPLAWCLGGLGIGLLELWARGGFFWLGWKIGLFQPAPERLVRIVTETASRMQVPVREVLLMRVAVAQAAALPGQGKLLFTERILELLPDDELAVVCAHELGHLTESRSDIAKRMIGRLIFMPWLFFNPLIHTYGNVAFFGLCLLTVVVPRVSRHISRRLELRADAMAKTNEGDAGTYARALTRLYEDNLSPAVNAKKMATHPHLYDRLLAAGVTPDFPRPAAPAAMAVTGSVFAGLVGMLFAWFVIRMMNP